MFPVQQGEGDLRASVSLSWDDRTGCLPGPLPALHMAIDLRSAALVNRATTRVAFKMHSLLLQATDRMMDKRRRERAIHASGSQLTARTRHAILSYPIPMCVAGAGRLDRARGGRGAGQGKSYCRRNRRRRRRWPLSRRPIRCWRCAVAALMMNFESGTEHASGRVIEEKKP